MGEDIVKNWNKTKAGSAHSTNPCQRAEHRIDHGNSLSTEASIILSMLMSMEQVMLDSISTRIAQMNSHQLYVDLPLFCIGFLSQPSEPAPEVFTTSLSVTWLTFIILVRGGQSISNCSNFVV